MDIKQNVNRFITFRTWVRFVFWWTFVVFVNGCPCYSPDAAISPDRPALSFVCVSCWSNFIFFDEFIVCVCMCTSTNAYSHEFNVFQQRDFIYLVWACKHCGLFGKTSMTSRSFSASLSQLQNGDRTWCKKLNPWCSSNVTSQSPTQNMYDDLSKSFALKFQSIQCIQTAGKCAQRSLAVPSSRPRARVKLAAQGLVSPRQTVMAFTLWTWHSFAGEGANAPVVVSACQFE